ncbi:hypothetical protein HAX54_043601 [Datura stramonium]|uniref:GH3 C-terminal domain-containing protein n=1 Tax=Datura stramonium TaxID=4076 RepID=A0ABS8SNR3_DATST|nr:hypothetical protein [Datura stramonium]
MLCLWVSDVGKDSSGTTQGRPKFVPFNDELMESTMQIYKTSFAYRNREFPIENGKALQFIYSSKQFKTKEVWTAGTATTNVYRNAHFKKTMKALQTPCCSPDEVIFGPDFHQSLYCHLLCGLIFRDEVQVVSSTFAHSIVHGFRTFEQVWEELVADIREGVLSSRVTVPFHERSAMLKLLKPDPEQADTIYNKCSGLSNWQWLDSSTLSKCQVHIRNHDCPWNLTQEIEALCREPPLLSADYGVNLDGLEPTPVGLAEVKLGEEYEIVVTNFAARCVEAAAMLLVDEKLEVVDFTSHVNITTDPGNSRGFWELSGEASDEKLQECCNCLDKAFVDAGYVGSRKANVIGALVF